MQAMATKRNAAIERELAAISARRHRTLKRKTSTGEAPVIDEATNENGTSDWLRNALAGSLRVFGEHMDGRFAEVQRAQESLHQRQDILAEDQAEVKQALETTVARVESLEQNTTETADLLHRRLFRHDEVIQSLGNHTAASRDLAEKAHQRLEILEHLVKNWQQAASTAPRREAGNAPPDEIPTNAERRPPPFTVTAGAAPPPPHQPPQPASQAPRLLARIGNLGWDTHADILVQRASSLLESAGVPHEAVTAMVPVTGRAGTGSACEAMFVNETELLAAKMKIRGNKTNWVDGKPAWLDYKKSMEELAPARTIHRCAELVQDVELRRPDRGDVVKNAGAKLVTVNHQRCFYTVGGVLKPTHFAVKRYREAELRSIIDFSTAD